MSGCPLQKRVLSRTKSGIVDDLITYQPTENCLRPLYVSIELVSLIWVGYQGGPWRSRNDNDDLGDGGVCEKHSAGLCSANCDHTIVRLVLENDYVELKQVNSISQRSCGAKFAESILSPWKRSLRDDFLGCSRIHVYNKLRWGVEKNFRQLYGFGRTYRATLNRHIFLYVFTIAMQVIDLPNQFWLSP